MTLVANAVLGSNCTALPARVDAQGLEPMTNATGIKGPGVVNGYGIDHADFMLRSCPRPDPVDSPTRAVFLKRLAKIGKRHPA